MKLSTKCRYGARALLEIARHYSSGTTIKRKEIVDIHDIADSYLENILVTLRNAGIIRTIRGAKGGYSLTRHPSEITFLEIVEAIQGSIAPIDCLDSSPCLKQDDCLTRIVWTDLYEAEKKALEKHTLQSILDIEAKNGSPTYVI